MKMTKKLLYLIVTILVIISTLVSCGGGEEPPQHVHVYGEWALRKLPICKEPGREVRYCTCGERENRDIPKTSDHEWVEATVDYPKNCTVCGATEGEPLTRVDVKPSDSPLIPYQ